MFSSLNAEIIHILRQAMKDCRLTHLCPPLRSTFAVRESASLGIMGEPEVPPLCRETQSLGQQMLERWQEMIK